jgi:hypothetical protein
MAQGGRLVACGSLIAAVACAPAAPTPRASAPSAEPAADAKGGGRAVAERDFIEPLAAERGLVSKQVALALLRRSSRRWHELMAGWPRGYGYLRSHRLKGERYRHTYVDVAAGRVVSRFGLDVSRYANDRAFREVGEQIGEHDDFDPALTIEQIHERCRALIAIAPGQMRLMTRADGLLAACALPGSRCEIESDACFTLHAVFAVGERPCVAGAELRPHGSRWPLTLGPNPDVFGRHCFCENGMVGCED